jgi:hypothetical protein
MENTHLHADKARFSLLFRHLYSTLTTSQINKALRDAGLSHSDWMDLVQYMKFEDAAEGASKADKAECDWCEEREAERKCFHCEFIVCHRCFVDDKCPNCSNGTFKELKPAE